MPSVVSSWVSQPRAFGQQRQAEVQNLHAPIGGDQQVAGFDVAVNDLLLVRGMETVGDLASNVERLSESERTALDRFLQALALDELQGKEGFSLRFVNFMDRANVGMTERGGCFRFPFKSLAALLVLKQVSGQEFQRDGALELGVFGLVNNTHAAFAELADDAVMRDGLTDHLP